MKRRFKSLFFAVGVLLMMDGCQTKDSLPEPTMEGRNTFGCKINGKVWIADGMPAGMPPGTPGGKPIEVDFKRLNADTFYLFIHTNASTKERVQLTLPMAVVGVNPLSDREPFAVYYDDNFRHFFSKGPNAGKVVITKLDTVNRIISGTFEFEGQEIIHKQKVSVTEGRFDLDLDSL